MSVFYNQRYSIMLTFVTVNSKEMNRILFTFLLIVATIAQAISQKSNQTASNMKMNAGIITSRIKETKAFYTQTLNFGVTFENEFYLLMHTPGHTAELSFLLPNHPSQQPLFQKPFKGEGMYLTIEVDDVDKVYEEIKKKGVPIKIELKDEPWGDRHFAIEDPNGIGIDIVKYSPKTD